MKRKISLYICAFAMLFAVLAAGVFAQTYMPDNDGQYSIPFKFEANNEYVLVVVKGTYDQTNYLEAYYNADDSDILYFEQKVSDGNGNVTFGPFVPNGYYDATLIVGGVTFGEPYLAGYLSDEGISNSATVEVSGIEKVYYVDGIDGADRYSEISVEVLDTFGYPSVTNEEVKIELLDNEEGVSLNGNTLFISKMAKEQLFVVKVSAGDAVKRVFVQVDRYPSVSKEIRVYTDEDCKQSLADITVKGLAGAFEPLTVYAKTFDQFGDEVADEYEFVYGGESVESTFVPSLGVVTLSVNSKNSDVVAVISVNAVERPNYQEEALEFFELIKTCAARLAEDKNISVKGWEVYGDEVWTTQASVDKFAEAIKTAEAALDLYGTNGYYDDDYSDEITTLTRALNSYNNSFSAGSRVDATSIRIELQDIITTANTPVTVKAVSEPNLVLTTEELVWSSSDESVATVTPVEGKRDTATIKTKASGKATITVTTRNGLTATTEVTVIKKASDILLSASSATATYGETPVVLTATIKPTGCTDTITWTVDNPELADLEFNEYIDENNFRIIEATVIPKSAGKAKITVSALYGQQSSSKEITINMPAWEKANSPVADVESGIILPGTKVELTSTTPGSKIYYTLDGTEPSEKNGRLYRAPFAINQSLTLKAVAVADQHYHSDVVTYVYRVANAGVIVSDVDAEAGMVVDVAVEVTGFMEVNKAEIELAIDPTFTFVGFESNYDVTVTEKSANVLEIVYEKFDEVLYDGTLLTLKLSVSEDAQLGKYEISVAKATVHSDAFPDYEAAVSDGAVNVVNYRLGDANNDGEIGLADVLLIKQYLAGNESAMNKIIFAAADVDVDGDVDEDDLTLISRYCVGWDVTFGPQSTVSDYRIIAYYDIGMDYEDNWKKYYEVYDPINGTKVTDIPSVEVSDKASTLSEALETGTVVKISADGTIDENNIVGKIDNSGLVWIKSMTDTSMVVVPVDETVECKNCATEYVASFNEATYNDFLGNKQKSNVVKIDSNTKFVSMTYSDYSSSFFKWSSMRSEKLEDVKAAKNFLRCYNDRSEDNSGNFKKTVASYLKALVCADANGTAKFVIVIVNGDEKAAYNIPCENCNK